MMTLELGGNISLSGFSELEPATLIVVKKMVGNYTKKIAERSQDFQSIHIDMKKVHEKNHEVHVKVNADKVYNSEVVDFNLFFALDKALSKVMHEMGNR
ncbi:MAG: hypothetical protein Q7R96_04685 [Nanoarchaeota archaeon]|nr:hypothetical protein [Nanoarchaeota archaeon]